jgi:murein DD-endopeptidase MepM/ murein hydrolase activator NlpD
MRRARSGDIVGGLLAARDAGLFGKIVDFEDLPVIIRDFTKGPAFVAPLPKDSFDIGKYNERRVSMYETELFKDEDNKVEGYSGKREIHIGIDIGGNVDTPLLAFCDGTVLHFGYNSEQVS